MFFSYWRVIGEFIQVYMPVQGFESWYDIVPNQCIILRVGCEKGWVERWTYDQKEKAYELLESEF